MSAKIRFGKRCFSAAVAQREICLGVQLGDLVCVCICEKKSIWELSHTFFLFLLLPGRDDSSCDALLGVIIFGSDQEVAGLMRAVKRMGATGNFSWIGSDGWSARALVSDGNSILKNRKIVLNSSSSTKQVMKRKLKALYLCNHKPTLSKVSKTISLA